MVINVYPEPIPPLLYTDVNEIFCIENSNLFTPFVQDKQKKRPGKGPFLNIDSWLDQFSIRHNELKATFERSESGWLVVGAIDRSKNKKTSFCQF